MSRSATRMRVNYERVLTKFFAEHPEHRRLRRIAWSYLYMDGSWCSLSEGDLPTARDLMIKSLYTWPWSYHDGKLQHFLRTRIVARLLLGETVFGKLSSLPRESQ
jgi:hypothetical protein